MQQNLDFSKFLLKNLEFSKLIRNAYKNNKQIEKSIKMRFKDFSYNSDILFPNEKINFVGNIKKNFFTFLMLSFLEKLEIEKSKLIKYGEIIFCLRTIITCTDNMIDNENKGIVFIKNIDNSIVNNTLLLMSTQNILSNILIELDDKEGKTLIFILNKIYSIAKSESLRDSSIYSTYPSPSYIIDKIHRGIGGELLQLSLWSPTYLENIDKISYFNDALFDIGMSLQALDDLCDMEEDFLANKINLGISKFINEFNIDINNILDNLKNKTLIQKYPIIYEEYINSCIDTAVKGFEKLNKLNYPISKEESIFLLKYMFNLRGIGELWDNSKYKMGRLT